VRIAFLISDHFPLLHLNPGRDCHELKDGHSVKLAWLRSLFLHRLKFWAGIASLNADHFPLLHLNPGRDCHELSMEHSLDWLG
jgi:hypothetical protein